MRGGLIRHRLCLLTTAGFVFGGAEAIAQATRLSRGAAKVTADTVIASDELDTGSALGANAGVNSMEATSRVPRDGRRVGVVSRGGMSANSNGGASASSVLWPLAAVLGMIGGAAIVARRLFRRSSILGGGGAIQILARNVLSSKQSLCLVRLGQRLILCGVTPDRITAIASIDDAEEASIVLAQVERGRAGSFTSSLARIMAEPAGRTSAGRLPDADDEFAVDREAPRDRQLSIAGDVLRGLAGRVRRYAETERRAGAA